MLCCFSGHLTFIMPLFFVLTLIPFSKNCYRGTDDSSSSAELITGVSLQVFSFSLSFKVQIPKAPSNIAFTCKNGCLNKVYNMQPSIIRKQTVRQKKLFSKESFKNYRINSQLHRCISIKVIRRIAFILTHI